MKCPICRKEYKNIIGHCKRSKEENHNKLYNLFINDKRDLSKEDKIIDIYNNNEFNYEVSYKNIEYINCNGECRKCYKDWKEDYNNCKQERKLKFEEQEKEYIKKVDNNPLELLRYFYNKTNTNSPSIPRETHQIKLLINKGYDKEDIKITMDFLIKRKNIDLRFLNRSIDEALLEYRYKKQMKEKGTLPNLLYIFHRKAKTNMINLIGEVNKLQMLIDEGYTIEDIKNCMKYMLSKNCKIINYIPNMIDEAKEFYKEKDKDEEIKNDLKYAIIKLNNNTDKKIIDIAKNIYNKGEFFKDYTKLEWAYIVNLSLDKDMIIQGIEEKKHRPWYYENNIVDYEDEFKKWLEEQKNVL